MAWEKIAAEEISGNLFERIGRQWFLLTAGTDKDWNAMTCSWGMAGVLWNHPAVTCYVRRSRHTLSFMEKQETFTLSFFPENERKALAYCGTHSGRDGNKTAEAGLHPELIAGDAVTFKEAEMVLVCRKRFAADIDPKNLPQEIVTGFYSGDAAHRMYIGEILGVYVASDD